MTSYEAKRAARVERLRASAEKHTKIAENNSFSRVTGEANTGIPMGQPILVGHHSERRHRKHLERIDNKIRKGFEAAETAQTLSSRADTLENRTAIDSDNPEAQNLLADKIKKLEETRDLWKKLNVLVKKFKTPEALAIEITHQLPETKDPFKLATNLLTPDFAGRLGIPDYKLTNTGAEIRRLKKRQVALEKVQGGFESFEVNGIKVELVEGQIQVDFGYKPSDSTRSMLKCSPLALKWSSYSKKWVRKHTETTASQYFLNELKRVLAEAKP